MSLVHIGVCAGVVEEAAVLVVALDAVDVEVTDDEAEEAGEIEELVAGSDA